jgi:hypothetical protein
MRAYVAEMIDESMLNLSPKDTDITPAAEDLFAEGSGDLLKKDKAKLFHKIVAKGLFLCKRARPNIHPTIAVLCTRVRRPNQDDWRSWRKMVRLIRYLNGTREDRLYLSADDLHLVHWHINAAFAVHPNFRSHTGGIMTYGGGAAQSISRKQKLNTRSSTEAKLVGVNGVTMILWMKLFMEAQGYEITHNILYQDYKSAIILLETNGKKSSSKRT